MKALSFVHAADLHLDAAFRGFAGLPESGEHVFETLRRATFEAFENLIRLCLDEDVDFLLVAGDVYNAADRSLKAQLAFRDGMGRLAEAGIRAYVVHGNHDPLDSRVHSVRLPETVHVFGKAGSSVVFEKGGEAVARIHGASFPSRTVGVRFARKIRREGPEPFQIGLLHCTVGSHPEHEPYVPRTLEELRQAGLDYWALGHVHTRAVLSDGDPFVGYPGNLQGLHVKEGGPRGCFLVRVDEAGRMPPPEFVAVDAVRWSRRTVSIEGLSDIQALEQALGRVLDEEARGGGGRPVVVRIVVDGRGPLHGELLRGGAGAALLEGVREAGAAMDPFVWPERLLVRTRPEVDIERRRAGDDFVGECLRLIQEYRGAGAGGREPLRACLDELFGHGRASRFLPALTDDDLVALLDEVETLCVDRLIPEEG